MSERTSGGISIYLSGIVAGIWVALAWRNPENTYHVAPLLIAATFPIGQRLKLGRLARSDAVWASVGGFVNVAVATTLLAVAGKLDGAALGGFWHAAAEAIAMGVLGAILGGWLATAKLSLNLAKR